MPHEDVTEVYGRTPLEWDIGGRLQHYIHWANASKRKIVALKAYAERTCVFPNSGNLVQWHDQLAINKPAGWYAPSRRADCIPLGLAPDE